MKEFWNNLLEQAYIYIPMVCTFITAVGLPSLVQVAKIFASANLYLTQVKYLKNKVNECVEMNNKMIEYIDNFVDDEISYNTELLKCTYNKQQKQLIIKRITSLEQRKVNNKIFKITAIENLPQKAEKTKKVVVKIKKGIDNGNTNIEKAQNVANVGVNLVKEFVDNGETK